MVEFIQFSKGPKCVTGNSNLLCSSEALRQTNLTMKERFEGLSAWREKQREERDFLESRLEEARGRMEALTQQNQDLSKRLEEAGLAGGSQVSVESPCFVPQCCII